MSSYPTERSTLTVGYAENTAASRRNILDVVPEAHYRRSLDFSRIARAVNDVFGARLMSKTNLKSSFADFDLSRVDLIHLFNSVSRGTTPWISTFETFIPRVQATLTCHYGKAPDLAALAGDSVLRRGVEALVRPACKRLIAMSECNLRMERQLLESAFPEHAPEIEPKLMQLHPPQPPLIEDYGDKPRTDGPLRFMFVGNSLFRKGGLEIVETLAAVRSRLGLDLELVFVGRPRTGDYATRRTAEEVKRFNAVVEANRDWIEYHEQLPYADVVSRMKTCHVGLLPTHADSYGYSVLEFQAAGCPVISTDGRALREINNDRVGWLIAIPHNPLGETVYDSPGDRETNTREIRAGLDRIVREIFANPAAVARKGAAALERIRQEHSPQRYAETLRGVYAEALEP